jgi:hypothetical protein
MIFKMPLGDDVRIESQHDGKYIVYWGRELFFLVCSNKSEAVMVAFALQWAAKKTLRDLNKKEKSWLKQ